MIENTLEFFTWFFDTIPLELCGFMLFSGVIYCMREIFNI